MKRLLSSVFTLLCVVSSVSCSTPSGTQSKLENNLDMPFSAKMTVNLDKLSAEGTIYRKGDRCWEAEFESPNTLSGVKLSFEENVVKASYKGLDFSVPKSAVPVKAMITNLMEAVDSLAAQEQLTGTDNEGITEISGSLEGGDYSLSLDSQGNIYTFEMPNNLLKINFSEVEYINYAPSPAETTISAVATEITTVETTTQAT